MKLTAIIPLMLSVGANASTNYKSFANEVKITKEMVSIDILELNGETPECYEEGLSFPLDEVFSTTWLETVVLSRQQQQLLDFGFDANTCELHSIAMPALYGNGAGDTASGPLDETGLNRNVALIGTNGISEASITSSSTYSSDSPAAAFDGYIYNEQYNEDSNGKIKRGIWLTKYRDDSDEPVKPWIQIDFNQSVELTAVGFHLNAKSLSLGRLPRVVTVLTSMDGNSFDTSFVFSLVNAESNFFSFPTKTNARFYRLEFQYNFGDKTFFELDEIEFNQ